MSAKTNQLRCAPRSCGLAAALLAAAVGTAGCTRLDDFTAVELSDVSKRHPIGFATTPQLLIVEFAPDGEGLSANQEADVYRFVERYKSESTGPLRIAAPKSVAGHLASSAVARDIEAIVRNAGVDPGAVESSRYAGTAPRGSALTLSYDRQVAVTEPCGDWATNLGENRERLPYNDFGCATQRNLALNVANARDFQQPQTETSRSAERRGATWSDYTGANSSPMQKAAPTSGTAVQAAKQ